MTPAAPGSPAITPPVLIYQMGKVGSSSLFVTFNGADTVTGPVWHVHTLRYEKIGMNLVRNADWEQHRHMRDAITARRELEALIASGQPDPRGPWKVITPVRDPIARNLSAWFQHSDRHFPGLLEGWAKGTVTVEMIRDRFVNAYDHGIPARWFDQEYRDVLGLDVYQAPIDHARGFTILRAGLLDLLLVRMEDLDRLPLAVFERYAGVDGLKQRKVLQASSRPYKDVYKTFKRNVRFPRGFVEAQFNTPYARHFYTERERAALVERYVHGPGAAPDPFAREQKRPSVMESRVGV